MVNLVKSHVNFSNTLIFLFKWPNSLEQVAETPATKSQANYYNHGVVVWLIAHAVKQSWRVSCEMAIELAMNDDFIVNSATISWLANSLWPSRFFGHDWFCSYLVTDGSGTVRSKVPCMRLFFKIIM